MERFLSQDLVTRLHKVSKAAQKCFAKSLHFVYLGCQEEAKTKLSKKERECNLNLVSKSKVILFGGATGDTGKYIITGDTYAFDLIGFRWSKLDSKSLPD